MGESPAFGRKSQTIRGKSLKVGSISSRYYPIRPSGCPIQGRLTIRGCTSRDFDVPDSTTKKSHYSQGAPINPEVVAFFMLAFSFHGPVNF